MPLALEPGVGFPVWLESDAHKPEDTRPVFLCRSVSMRDSRKMRADYDALFAQLDTKTIDELYDQTLDELCKYVIGWQNMPTDMPFGRDGLAAVLTERQAWELLRLAQTNQSPSTEEKKS